MTLIRNGTLVPADLVKAYVDRIEAHDRVYQAYAARPTRQDLLDQAERIPADGMNAPLRGICFAPEGTISTPRTCSPKEGSLVFEGFSARLRRNRRFVDARGGAGWLWARPRWVILRVGEPGDTERLFRPPETRGRRTIQMSVPAGSSSGSGTAVAARLAVAGFGRHANGRIGDRPGQCPGV